MQEQNESKKYVKYFRVSTARQGKSKLGLDAQKAMLESYHPAIGEFTEIESGKKNNRKQLRLAIEMARKEKAILLVARIDRLSRDFAFVMALEQSGIDFEIAMLPGANRLTIHIMAAIAEQERELICARQRDAWSERKKRANESGKKIDFSKFTDATRKLGANARKQTALDEDSNIQAYAYAKSLREQGKSLNAIARELNAKKFKTTRKAKFYAATIKNIFKLFEGK